MTFNVRSSQPARLSANKPESPRPVAAEAPSVARAPAAPTAPSAGADAAIAHALGTGNLPSLDALLDRAASVAGQAAARLGAPAARVLSAAKEGRLSRFFQGVKRLLTPSPEQVKRVLDAVRQNVWERPLNWLAKSLGVDDMSHSIKVVADPPDVNAPNAAHEAQARRDLADPALKAATAKAVAQLPPADRRHYEALATQLAGQPRALAALQAFARQGKLAARDLAGGQSLLAHLHAIGAQPVDARVRQAGQTALLAQTVLEIAEPGAIAQKGVNTCGATVVQHMLTRDHPAEYARLIAGLASPAGRVTMQDGQTLRRDAEWDAEIDVSKRFGGVRSIPSRLIQPALMQHAGTFEYQNRRDGHIIPLLDKSVMGMVPWGMTRLIKSLTGRAFDWDVATRTRTFERRMREATPERPVPIALNYAERRGEIGPHWVQVVGFDEAANRVIALNPWGRKETIPLDVATGHLLAVVHPL